MQHLLTFWFRVTTKSHSFNPVQSPHWRLIGRLSKIMTERLKESEGDRINAENAEEAGKELKWNGKVRCQLKKWTGVHCRDDSWWERRWQALHYAALVAPVVPSLAPPSPFPAVDGQRDELGGEQIAGTPLAPKLQLITMISISKPPPGSLVHTTRQFRAMHFYLKTFIKRICYSKQATQSVLGLSKSCLLRCLGNVPR